MARKRQTIGLFLILALAAGLRLTALDWDGYQHYHPDERYISWVATTIEAPRDLASALDPHRSPFNPFYWPPDAESAGIVVLQDQPRSFAYGHLPLYLGVFATRLVEKISPLFVSWLPEGWALTSDLLNGRGAIEFRHLTAVARALTALFDVGTVALTFLLGRRIFGAGVGLLAAAFLAINVMHVQLARFFAVDPYLTFFTVAALYASLRLAASTAKERFWREAIVVAVAVGLAAASKFSAVMLALPLFLALWFQRSQSVETKRKAALLMVAVVVVTFALTNPFAVLDWSCSLVTPAVQIGPLQIPSLNWGSCYLDNVLRQSAMVRGEGDFDFTRQYVGTTPYVYPLLMQLRWGMGYLLGVPAVLGFAWALYRGAQRLQGGKRARAAALQERLWDGHQELILLAWTAPYFLVTGGFFVKFMRYMQPLTPFLMIYAAALLLKTLQGRRQKAVAGAILLGTALYAFAFLNMYQRSHPWNAVSEWIYENAPQGSLIASELWDDPLPSSMAIDGASFNRHIYDYTELTWLRGVGTQDNIEKLTLNLSRVAQADYVTISSNRGYGVITRLEELYPLSHQYYERLFAGDLGYEVVAVAGRSPQLADVALWPNRFEGTGLAIPPAVQRFPRANRVLRLGRADESFTVYDQPLAIIFQNTGRLTVEEMLSQFEQP